MASITKASSEDSEQLKLLLQNLGNSREFDIDFVSYSKMTRTQCAHIEYEDLINLAHKKDKLGFVPSQITSFYYSVQFDDPEECSTAILNFFGDCKTSAMKDGGEKKHLKKRTALSVKAQPGIICYGKAVVELFLRSRNGGFCGLLPEGTICCNPLGCDYCMLQVCVWSVLKDKFTDIVKIFGGHFGHINIRNGRYPFGGTTLVSTVSHLLELLITRADLAKISVRNQFSANIKNCDTPASVFVPVEDSDSSDTSVDTTEVFGSEPRYRCKSPTSYVVTKRAKEPEKKGKVSCKRKNVYPADTQQSTSKHKLFKGVSDNAIVDYSLEDIQDSLF